MKLEIVESKTADKLTLHGILYTPEEADLPLSPALLYIHGAAYNFYETPLRPIAERLARQGYPGLVTNTRGHDWVANSYREMGYIGTAFELLEDCIPDIDATIGTLEKRGYDDIVIVAHSLGAVKTLYYQSQRAHQKVRAIVLCAPPNLSNARMSGIDGFGEMMATATNRVEQHHNGPLLSGDVPIRGFFSPRTFVNKYNADDRSNALRYVDKINCPVLFICGTSDHLIQFAREIKDRTSSFGWQYHFVEGADHTYRGFEDEVAQKIGDWLRDRLT